MAAKHWIRLTICGALAGVVAAAVLVQHHRHSRATVAKVESAVLRASPRADHVVVGGRTFRLSHATVDGHGLLAAVATDTKGLNENGAIVRTRGPLSLNWTGGDPGHQRVRFEDAAGHQVLVIGGPGERNRRAMSNLAVRLAS